MSVARALDTDREEGIDRRRCLFALLPVPAAFAPGMARAGAQLEEPLMDAVRKAMSDSVGSTAPLEPVFPDTAAKVQYLRWKVAMNTRLVNRRSDLRTLQERDDFLQTVWYNSKRQRIATDLVLGLIQVESNFRKYAVSSAGARGYMQVMPFWTRLLVKEDARILFNMHINLSFGCEILRHYLLDLEAGNLFMALGRYNGSRGKPAYPQAVLAAAKQWEFSPS